jgi:hypothetical protein
MLALAIYCYTIATGLAGTYDSYHYLYAAQTLRQSGQLLTPEGVPYQAWPPLFPIVLNLIGGAGAVAWVNGVAMVGALIAWSLVGRQVLPVGRAWALPLLLALGSPTLVVSKFIWSEPLFNLLWANYFWLLLAWLQRGGRALGLLVTVVGCLMPLQRIAGAFLLVGVGMGLAWPSKERWMRPSRWALLVHFLGTTTGLIIWQLYLGNSLVPRTLTAPTPGKTARLLAALAEYGFVLERWLIPLPMLAWRLLPALVWMVALGLLLWWLRPREVNTESTTGPLSILLVVCSRMLFTALVATIGFLAAATMLERIGVGLHEAERYLTVLYPVVVILALLTWPTNKRWAIKLGPALLVSWILYQGVRIGHNAHQLQQLPPANVVYVQRLLSK